MHRKGLDKNAQECKFYVNGVVSKTIPGYSHTVYDDPRELRLGGWYGTTTRFDGIVDEIAIFDNALSETEINQIYTASIAGSPYCT